jgi:hypothetical protein
MGPYESTERVNFPRGSFLACGSCKNIFVNTVSSGTFCRRCRGGDLRIWRGGRVAVTR